MEVDDDSDIGDLSRKVEAEFGIDCQKQARRNSTMSKVNKSLKTIQQSFKTLSTKPLFKTYL